MQRYEERPATAAPFVSDCTARRGRDRYRSIALSYAEDAAALARFAGMRLRATGLRAVLRRRGGDFAITGTASISLADAPASPRERADWMNAPATTPISKANPALNLGYIRTALARADTKPFERAAMLTLSR